MTLTNYKLGRHLLLTGHDSLEREHFISSSGALAAGQGGMCVPATKAGPTVTTLGALTWMPEPSYRLKNFTHNLVSKSGRRYQSQIHYICLASHINGNIKVHR